MRPHRFPVRSTPMCISQSHSLLCWLNDHQSLMYHVHAYTQRLIVPASIRTGADTFHRATRVSDRRITVSNDCVITYIHSPQRVGLPVARHRGGGGGVTSDDVLANYDARQVGTVAIGSVGLTGGRTCSSPRETRVRWKHRKHSGVG